MKACVSSVVPGSSVSDSVAILRRQWGRCVRSERCTWSFHLNGPVQRAGERALSPQNAPGVLNVSLYRMVKPQIYTVRMPPGRSRGYHHFVVYGTHNVPPQSIVLPPSPQEEHGRGHALRAVVK